MKKILIIISLFFYNTYGYANNIVYLDIQYIIDNSNIGKHYKKKIQNNQKLNQSELKKKELLIKKKENEIQNQKNILNKDVIEKKVKDINIMLNDFQTMRNKFNKSIIETKKSYTGEILKILNPLLTSYVDKNNILLVVEKKNILIGVKSLDITSNILQILNEETNKKNLINEN